MDSILEKDFEEIIANNLPWNCLKNKYIFCTGATGFLFRYFIKFLCWLNQRMQLNITLELYCRTNSTRINDEDLCGTDVYWLEGDITKVSEYMHDPDIIIHAASPANQKSWINGNMVGLVDTNVIATKNLLEKARQTHATMLYISSGEVYPASLHKISEQSFNPQMPPRSFYGACKLAGELLCEQYKKKYKLLCPIIRPSSIYGPGENLESGRHFMDFIKQTLNRKPIMLSGTGMQQRTYCYLTDFIKGIFYILLHGDNTVYNIGNEQNICTIFQMAELISSMGSNQGVVCSNISINDTTKDIYILDTQKLRTLGWRPTVNLKECVERTIKSYQ